MRRGENGLKPFLRQVHQGWGEQAAGSLIIATLHALDTFNLISFHFQLRFLLHCSWHAGNGKATHAHTRRQQLKLTAQKYKPNQMHIFQIHWICSVSASPLLLPLSSRLSCAVSFYRYKHFAFMLYLLVFSPMHISGFSWRRQRRRWRWGWQRLRLQLCRVGKFNWKWSVHAPLHCARVCVRVCVSSAAHKIILPIIETNWIYEMNFIMTESRCEIGNFNWSLSNNQHQIHNEQKPRVSERDREQKRDRHKSQLASYFIHSPKQQYHDI